MNRERLTLRACRTCTAPTIYTDATYPLACDPHNLTAPDEARAWLDDRPTYRVQTIHRRQLLRWRAPSPIAMRDLAQEIANPTPRTITVLAAHDCPGPALTDTSLADWQPVDRIAFHPQPRPRPATDDKVPF